MAIADTDILLKLSITTGSAGNQSAQSDPNASLGKYVSTTELSGTAQDNLFDDVSGAENTAGTTDYRCVFVHNSHATLTLQNAVLWCSGGDPAGGATVDLAVDTTAASAIGSSSAQADQIADENTAPTGIGSWSLPTSSGASTLDLGDIPAGYCKAFWVRRTVDNVAAVSAETLTWAVTGDTAA